MLFGGILLFYSKEVYIYVSHYYVLDHLYPGKMLLIDCFRLGAGLFGSIIAINWICIVYRALPSIIIKFITLLGQNTLGIYIISSFIFELVLRPVASGLDGLNYIIRILETLLITIVSFLFNLILKRINIINIFLLGGR